MSQKRVILEIAIESTGDACAAADGGADRLELCTDLTVDGLTPNCDTLDTIKVLTGLPVMVMIRPRPGNFSYTHDELRQMQASIAHALERDADGLVFGVLTDEQTVDQTACRSLMSLCAGRPAVFHRAFDQTPSLEDALEQIIDLGFSRILTSGGASDAPRGAEMIGWLISQARGRIDVLPGGGIRAHNVAELIRTSGCTQVHSSCRGTNRRAPTPQNARLERRIVAALRKACDSTQVDRA